MFKLSTCQHDASKNWPTYVDSRGTTRCVICNCRGSMIDIPATQNLRPTIYTYTNLLSKL